MTSRYPHITRPGREKAALDRAARAIELQFDYYGPFGFGAVVARLDEPMFDLNKRVTAEILREREIAIHGSKQYVIDTIMKMREQCGYEDFCFMGWFELGGFEAKEIEEQMQIFAEEVMPVLARERGGKVELPARGLDFTANLGDTQTVRREEKRWQAKRARRSTGSTATGLRRWRQTRRCHSTNCVACSSGGGHHRRAGWRRLHRN